MKSLLQGAGGFPRLGKLFIERLCACDSLVEKDVGQAVGLCDGQRRESDSAAREFGKWQGPCAGGRKTQSTHEFVRDDGAVTESSLRPVPRCQSGIYMCGSSASLRGSGAAAPLTVTSSTLSSPLLNLASS